MEPTNARRMMADWFKPSSRPDKQMSVTPDARALLDTDHDGKITSDELLAGLVRDQVSIDPKLREIFANRSKLSVDAGVMPRDQSAYFNTVEECGEFAMRYFKEERSKGGKTGPSFETDFGVQHDLSDTVRRMAAGTEVKAGYSAFLNGSITPPRAGDVLIAQSDDGSEFHVAIVAGVAPQGAGWAVTVYQANVPFDTNSPAMKDHLQELPLVNQGGQWSVSRLPTAAAGYGADMGVVGWIHPGADKALPGAAL